MEGFANRCANVLANVLANVPANVFDVQLSELPFSQVDHTSQFEMGRGKARKGTVMDWEMLSVGKPWALPSMWMLPGCVAKHCCRPCTHFDGNGIP